MRALKNNFRRWWQIPRKAGVREDRQVSFLELFYDLVYVVIIAELAHTLATHMSLTGLANFLFMFVIVWHAWTNGTAYHEIHGNNDVKTRIFTFLQMLAVIAMAVFAHNAIGSGSTGFAISYGFFQLILTFLWWRTGVHEKEHAPLSNPYSLMFLCTTILFFVSVLFQEPVRYYLWGVAIIISLSLPAINFSRGIKSPEIREQIKIVTSATHSMVERMGLFNIIVLGEVIVGVVAGITSNSPSYVLIFLGLFGSLIAIGLWWVYFDFVSHRIPKAGIVTYLKWMYLHLPITAAITAIGAATLFLIEHSAFNSSAVWILLGSQIVFLIGTAVLTKIVVHQKEFKKAATHGSVAMVISSFLLILVGIVVKNTFVILAMSSMIIFIPVVVGFLTWINLIDKTREK